MVLYYPSVKTLFHSQGGAPSAPALFTFTSYKFEYANPVGEAFDTEVNQNWNLQSWYSQYFTWMDYTNDAGCHSFVIPATQTYRVRLRGADGGQIALSNPYQAGSGALIEFDYPFTQGDIIAFVLGRCGGTGGGGSGGGGGTFLFFRNQVNFALTNISSGYASASSDAGLIGIAGGGGGAGHNSGSARAGNGLGGSDTTDSTTSLAGDSVGGQITNGTGGSIGIGLGGKTAQHSLTYGYGAGGGGWKGPGQNGSQNSASQSGYANGGGTYYYSSTSDASTLAWGKWFGSSNSQSGYSVLKGGLGRGAAAGGRCCGPGGGGGYTGGGAGNGFNSGWGSGGGGGSYVDSAATNVVKTRGTDAGSTNTGGFFELIA